MSQRNHVLTAMVIFAFSSLTNFALAKNDEQTEQSETNDDVELITVVASRTERDPNEVPATVSVITENQMDRELNTDIADLIYWADQFIVM